MTVTSPSDQTSGHPIHWRVLLQLVFSALVAFLLFAAAGIFILTGLTQYFTHGSNPADLTEPFMVAGSLIFAGALVIPSAWYAWKQLAYPAAQPISRPEPRLYGLVLTIIVLVVTGLALLVGNLVAQNDKIAWLLLPPLNVIVSGLPALWVIYFGTRGLLPNSPRHKWGVFAGGLVLGPVIILVAELTLLLVVGILALTWLTQTNPSLSNQIPGILSRLRSYGPDTEAVLHLLLPYLLNPVVIFLGLSFISVLVPLLEETVKPIGVWFLAGSMLTPAMGFGFGVLSGAGFGLFENLGNTSGAGSGWALLAGSRISTLLLHSFTAGLVGWGLASAWRERRFLRLALCFMTAVLIHGLWNGMAVLSAAASLQQETSLSMPSGLPLLGSLSTLGIFVLGVMVVLAFFGFNAYFRRSNRSSSSPGDLESKPPRYVPGTIALPEEPPRLILDDISSPHSQPREEPPPDENDLPNSEAGENLHPNSDFNP